MSDEPRSLGGTATKPYSFEVVSPRYIHGEPGDIVSHELTEDQAEALLSSGAVKLAEPVSRATKPAARKEHSNG